ncbi:MAG TPA: prolyl oligopeptidase family serine peptidase [Terracidiphilus sp.]|nr:prolyl oligopeptidase family serine peptidase [Terracidiphilus sp.]
MHRYRLCSRCTLVFLINTFRFTFLSAIFLPAVGFAQSFTIEQALSAPFTSELRAAPSHERIAWVANIGGRRNIWVAEPDAGGQNYTARQVTHYTVDDGQELSAPEWTPDAATIVYVRGSSAQGETHPVPNPQSSPLGEKQQIWAVDLSGGEPRLIAEGSSPAISPEGNTLAFISKGQIWTVAQAPSAKPEQLLQTRGSAMDLRWSPDGTKLGFVSARGDHSFIAICTVAPRAIVYIDPSSDLDHDLVWSPDSSSIAYIRSPSDRDSTLFVPHRSGIPWSIRTAEVATGRGRDIWRASEGVGSIYRDTDSEDQLHWVGGNRIVFPWERDGWLHFYEVPVAGGTASLLTPGDFEVEHVSMSPDRKLLAFDSNEGDIDRRHVWKISFGNGNSTGRVQPVTTGEGIETQPVVASDNKTIAVLRSDVQTPMRAALARDGKLVDLAPQAIPLEFPGARFLKPQQVIFPAADGMAIHGQLFLPAGLRPGERRPAAVFFHGGSERQMLLGWHYMEYYSNAYAMNQYLASKGYVVLSVNYRSGIGYGMNFREALNYGADGASEFNDVLGAGLYLRSRPDVDVTRIASWGGSYGGYLTALALARASNIFAAGVDMHGVHDWNLEIPTFSPNYNPQEKPEAARLAFESSPVASIATWRSPVLLVHGDDDRNVPFAETVLLAEALRKQHVDFEELIFPDEIHDFLLRRSWVRAYSAADDFLDRKLNPGTNAAVSR